MAEWSRMLAQDVSPQGCGFETRSCSGEGSRLKIHWSRGRVGSNPTASSVAPHLPKALVFGPPSWKILFQEIRPPPNPAESVSSSTAVGHPSPSRENYLWLQTFWDIIEVGTSKQPLEVPLNNSSQRKWQSRFPSKGERVIFQGGE